MKRAMALILGMLAITTVACAPGGEDNLEGSEAAFTEGGENNRFSHAFVCPGGERSYTAAFQYKPEGRYTILLTAGNGQHMMRSLVDFDAAQAEDEVIGLGFSKNEGKRPELYHLKKVTDLKTGAETYTFVLSREDGTPLAESFREYASEQGARDAINRVLRMYTCMPVG